MRSKTAVISVNLVRTFDNQYIHTDKHRLPNYYPITDAGLGLIKTLSLVRYQFVIRAFTNKLSPIF